MTMSSMSSITVYMALHFAKTSVGFFLLRLLSPPMHAQRWFIGITLGLLQIVTWFRLVAAFYPICSAALLAVLESNGCLEYNWAFGFAPLWNFYGMFIDFSYSTLPVLIISKLNLSKRRRLAFSVLVGLGWLATVCTLIRAVAPWRPDVARDVPLASSLETSLVLICGSLAALTPLYLYAAEGVPLKPRGQALAPNYVGETKEPMLARDSGSTVQTGRPVPNDWSGDTAAGIRVEREFKVTSSRENGSNV